MNILKYRKTIVALLVVAAGAYLAVKYLKDDTAASLLEAIERNGSRILGTRVDVARTEIEWDAGAVSLARLEIANPGGFSKRNMVSIESIHAAGDLQAGVINEMVLDGIDAVVEFRGAGSNFEVVGERAADNTGGSGALDAGEEDGVDEEGGDEADTVDETRFPEEWLIETISFENIRVTVQADWTSEQVELDAGGLSLENQEGRVDDLTRDIVIGFLGNILSAAAEQVENRRLKENLAERAEALHVKLREEEQGVEMDGAE